jgi:hypothetical protein
MGDQEAEPSRATPALVFSRTTRAVEIGNRALLEAIEQFNYDDAIQIARRMANMWLEGLYAYQIMVLNEENIPSLPANLRTLLDRQRELLTLFELILKADVSEAVRVAVHPLLSLLASIHPPQLPNASEGSHCLDSKL